jgi:hypothetical protein
MSEEESKQPAEQVKVSDRRSFTSEGDRRTPDLPRPEPARAPTPATAHGSAARSEEDREPAGIDFDSFVRYLAQVALHQMTGARDPATGEVIASLEEARQTIEILTMLKNKTRGNLTPHEAKSLDDLLHHLKIEFSRRAAAERR